MHPVSRAVKPEIPTIIHQIWLGPSPLPSQFAAFIDSWKRKHLGWEFRLYTDKSELPPLHCAEPYTWTTHPAARSDILRFELLYHFGGVYIDLDFECARDITPLMRGLTAFAGDQGGGVLNGAIMGCTPKNPVFGRMLNSLKASLMKADIRDHVYKHLDVSGPFFLTNEVKNEPSFTVFPPELFYPYTWTESFKGFDAYPKAYAAHHWAGTWNQQPKTAAPPGRGPMGTIYIVTCCSRLENLASIRASLKAHPKCKWVVIYDEGVTPVEGMGDIQLFCPVNSVRGITRTKNYALQALPLQADDWLFYLDDDNIMHPAWYDHVPGLCALSKYDVICWGTRRKDGLPHCRPALVHKVGSVDTASYIWRYGCRQDLRYVNEEAEDGKMAMAFGGPSLVLNMDLGYYNYLRPDYEHRPLPAAKKEPAHVPVENAVQRGSQVVRASPNVVRRYGYRRR